jgi:nucleoside-diphosphate-sugar epimerase
MAMRVLLTGANGFLGSYIMPMLQQQGAEIVRVGRQPTCEVRADLGADIPKLVGPFDWVIHAAGKAHSVPASAAEGAVFHRVNHGGTLRLCKALQGQLANDARVLFISTVAVYGVDVGEQISETAPLAGNTPYALSKIAAEEYLQGWCQQQGVALTIFRLPLVVGRHAPGNLGDMMNAIERGRYFNIGKGSARKSMVLAADVARGIPAALQASGIYNLTDGVHPSFAELASVIAANKGRNTPRSLPVWLARLAALAGDVLGGKAPIDSHRLKKLTSSLTFSDQLARQAFGWQPRSVLDAAKEWC